MRNSKGFKITALAVLGIISLAACSAPETAADEVAIHVGSGITEGQPVKGCVGAGVREVYWGQGSGDKFFYYPESQVIYDFTGGNGADAKPFEVISSDGQTVTISGTTVFDLNTDCDVLTAFHNNIGRRFQAYLENGDNGERVKSQGWRDMLNFYIGKQLDPTLDTVAKNFTWRELNNDVTVKEAINKAVNDQLAKLVNQQTDGDQTFFLNFSTSVSQPKADPELVQTIKDEEKSIAGAKATQAKAEADAAAAEAAANAQVAQKNAELQVKKLDAEIDAQKIAPYGSAQEYNFNKAIEKGLNPYQPSYGSGTIVDAK